MVDKKKYYISYTVDENGTTTKAIAQLVLQNVRKLYCLLLLLISDKNLQFISEVWKNLCKILGILANLFIFFHSKTNSQSEIAYQEIEKHLHTFVNY